MTALSRLVDIAGDIATLGTHPRIGEAEGSVQRRPPPRESASGNCRTARRQPFTARLSASSAMRLYVGAPTR